MSPQTYRQLFGGCKQAQIYIKNIKNKQNTLSWEGGCRLPTGVGGVVSQLGGKVGCCLSPGGL